MYFIILLLVYVLLFLTVYLLIKKISFRLFWKMTLFFLLVLISYKTEYFYIPIGIIIGLFMLKRMKTDLSIMKVTLVFALIAYIFANYLAPNIHIKYLIETINTYEQISKFDKVDTVKSFSPSEPIQENLKQYLDSETNADHFMLLTYILMDNKIEIKNKDWLLSASHELGVNGSRVSQNKNKDIIQLSYNGQDYLGIFDTSNKEPFLKLVIKGKSK